jgi:hypothetical protein
MTDRDWSRLTRTEVSRFGHAIIAVALEREGFAVSEPDDRGITDLIATRAGQRLEVTVRTLRSLTYTYVEKHRFDLRADRCVALVLLLAQREPLAFLIPAQAWRSPDAVLVSRDYEHAASRPEWGINVSRRNLALLERYALRTGNHEQ